METEWSSWSLITWTERLLLRLTIGRLLLLLLTIVWLRSIGTVWRLLRRRLTIPTILIRILTWILVRWERVAPLIPRHYGLTILIILSWSTILTLTIHGSGTIHVTIACKVDWLRLSPGPALVLRRRRRLVWRMVRTVSSDVEWLRIHGVVRLGWRRLDIGLRSGSHHPLNLTLLMVMVRVNTGLSAVVQRSVGCPGLLSL